MRDFDAVLVGGSEYDDEKDDETQREQEQQDQEREQYIATWKAMYQRKGIDPDRYIIDWEAVFEGERGE